MKKLKKIALLLVGVLMVGMLAGCSQKFDAQAYVKALLDASYKNDSAAFVSTKVGTAEEAAALYEEGIDSELDALLSTSDAFDIDVSDESKAEFRQIVKDLLSKVKYTVDSAEKQDDGSYVVTITYEQMKFFEPFMAEFETISESLATEWMAAEEGALSEDEMMEQLIVAYKDSMVKALENVEYAEADTATVTVELIDNVYTPDQSDVENLEMVFFDTDFLN